jgi:hypothetical protein
MWQLYDVCRAREMRKGFERSLDDEKDNNLKKKKLYGQVSTWDGDIGEFENAPPGLRVVLRNLGMAAAAAAKVFASRDHTPLVPYR